MPPGVAGSGDSGSGPSRVHSTKPSGRGAPEATPSENGSPPLQRRPWAKAPDLSAGAAVRPIRPAPAAPMKRRRSMCRPLRGDDAPQDDVRKGDVRKDMAAPSLTNTIGAGISRMLSHLCDRSRLSGRAVGLRMGRALANPIMGGAGADDGFRFALPILPIRSKLPFALSGSGVVVRTPAQPIRGTQ